MGGLGFPAERFGPVRWRWMEMRLLGAVTRHMSHYSGSHKRGCSTGQRRASSHMLIDPELSVLPGLRKLWCGCVWLGSAGAVLNVINLSLFGYVVL
uniref:Uncharacterized protein n=1 Tax=Knipowitschia caucasica TaxID=637954 RepID=A0AAV2MTV6_KNICA